MMKSGGKKKKKKTESERRERWRDPHALTTW